MEVQKWLDHLPLRAVGQPQARYPAPLTTALDTRVGARRRADILPGVAWPAALTTPFALIAAGAVLVAIGLALVRSSGARMGLGRRLAGASEVRVGDVSVGAAGGGPIRVAGRVRCSDPIVTTDGERLVALHRTVEVRIVRGRWRSIALIREWRGF